MTRTRDRHGRGLRGPLSLPHPWGISPLERPTNKEWFHSCVEASLEKISRHNPEALRHIVVGVEDVPYFAGRLTGNQVPMSAALESFGGAEARIVVYRRPLERRATGRTSLRALIHRTIVKQLSALTGLSIDDIVGYRPEGWDDF